MDSSQLLDILGNENRRAILELLSHKPCYVTEISEHIGVSPKAVIDHLEMLEEAGLIESTTDDRRRKYFNISRSLRLEVNVSPYFFGMKSAYPQRISTEYEYVEIDGAESSESQKDRSSELQPGEVDELVSRLERLEQIANELSIAQRHVQAEIDEVMSEIEEAVEADATEDVDSVGFEQR